MRPRRPALRSRRALPKQTMAFGNALRAIRLKVFGPEPVADTRLSLLPEPSGTSALLLQRIRSVNSADLPMLNQVMRKSPSYWLLTQGQLACVRAAEAVLNDLPPGLARDDKFLWGIWQEDRLIGCIDALRCWPSRDCAHIGFMLVSEGLQRQGLGMQALRLARQRMRKWPGVRRMRLAVAENNAPALAFWRRAGFRDTGQRDQQASFKAPLMVMERLVG